MRIKSRKRVVLPQPGGEIIIVLANGFDTYFIIDCAQFFISWAIRKLRELILLIVFIFPASLTIFPAKPIRWPPAIVMNPFLISFSKAYAE